MDEVEEVIENLMHDEIDYLDLSFDFCQQAPFTSLLLYDSQRLPLLDCTDHEFDTLLQVLKEALERNTSVQHVHVDWSFLRLLPPTEQPVLLQCIGRLPQLRTVHISGTTANTHRQQISVFGLLRLLEGLHYPVSTAIIDNNNPATTATTTNTHNTTTTTARLEALTMDAMGSLKLQDWWYVSQLSRTLQWTASYLQVLRLENLVLPQQQPKVVVVGVPPRYALEALVETLASTRYCPVLDQLEIAVSLPRQYRCIDQPLCSVTALAQLHVPTSIRLHNWGLQHDHVVTLFQLPRLISLDVWNNYPLSNKTRRSRTTRTRTTTTSSNTGTTTNHDDDDDSPSSSSAGFSTTQQHQQQQVYLDLLVNRQQMTLQKVRGIHDDDTCPANNATRDLFLLLNRCGRAKAAAAAVAASSSCSSNNQNSHKALIDYWTAINNSQVASRDAAAEACHQYHNGDTNTTTTTTTNGVTPSTPTIRYTTLDALYTAIREQPFV